MESEFESDDATLVRRMRAYTSAPLLTHSRKLISSSRCRPATVTSCSQVTRAWVAGGSEPGLTSVMRPVAG